MKIDADRAVSETSRRTNDGRIEYFKVFLPLDGIVGGSSVEMSRENLMKDIKDGKTVVTVVKKGTEWVRGEDVRVTSAEYLRTDANEKKKDNLGSLPEYNRPFA